MNEVLIIDQNGKFSCEINGFKIDRVTNYQVERDYDSIGRVTICFNILDIDLVVSKGKILDQILSQFEYTSFRVSEDHCNRVMEYVVEIPAKKWVVYHNGGV